MASVDDLDPHITKGTTKQRDTPTKDPKCPPHAQIREYARERFSPCGLNTRPNLPGQLQVAAELHQRVV